MIEWSMKRTLDMLERAHLERRIELWDYFFPRTWLTILLLASLEAGVIFTKNIYLGIFFTCVFIGILVSLLHKDDLEKNLFYQSDYIHRPRPLPRPLPKKIYE
jgi:hypothetical protein